MFKIFDPFKKSKGKNVIITSWNIVGLENFNEVIKNIDKAKSVKCIIGFSKQTHDLNLLKFRIFKYQKLEKIQL